MTRMRTTKRCLSVALCLIGAAAPLLAVQESPRLPVAADRPTHERAERRQAWAALDPAERARLLRNYREFQSLDPAERRERLERWRRFERRAGELRRVVPAELAQRLREMEPARRAELLREFMGHRLEELDARLAQRREQVRRQLRDLGQELGLDAAQLEADQRLDDRSRGMRLLELRARKLREQVQRRGLPAEVDGDEFERRSKLPPGEFLRWWSGTRTRAASHPRGSGQRGLDLLRPDPTWFAELAKLDPAQRRSEIERRLKLELLARLPALLEQAGNPLTAAERASLEALEGRPLRERALELLALRGLQGDPPPAPEQRERVPSRPETAPKSR